jgi:hypothetical protein
MSVSLWKAISKTGEVRNVTYEWKPRYDEAFEEARDAFEADANLVKIYNSF